MARYVTANGKPTNLPQFDFDAIEAYQRDENQTIKEMAAERQGATVAVAWAAGLYNLFGGSGDGGFGR